MKGTILANLITQISNLKQLESETKISNILAQSSIANNPSSSVQYLKEIIYEQDAKISQIISQYNNLLKKVNKLIDINYQIFEQTRIQFEDLGIELERNKKESQQKIQELETIISQNIKNIQQLRNQLLQKHEYVATLQDWHDREYKQKSRCTKNKEIQTLKYHKREKSQLCNKLEMENYRLLIENQEVKKENCHLLEQIHDLNEYIQQMEEYMTSVNIRSPRIINQRSDSVERGIFGSNRTFKEIKNNSIQQQSPITDRCQQAHQQAASQQTSSISSFLHIRRPLRDVLNISNSTNKYFNFRTKEKPEMSSKQLKMISNENIQNIENNENDLNFINGVQPEHKKYHNNIMEIKQFQVNDEIIKSNPIQKPIETKQKVEAATSYSQIQPQTLSVTVDPYYSYFILTIQCLKLNWKNMDEVANICLKDEWKYLIQNCIPINKWNEHLKDLMSLRAKTIK